MDYLWFCVKNYKNLKKPKETELLKTDQLF